MSTMFLFAQLNLVVSMVAVGVAQCLLRIDSSRLGLSLEFFRTRNMLVSTGTHILFINDWLLFVMNHCRHEDAWFMIEAQSSTTEQSFPQRNNEYLHENRIPAYGCCFPYARSVLRFAAQGR